MNRSDLIVLLAAIGFITIIVLVSENRDVQVASKSLRMQQLRDSLEMEWYKKQLESYPFEHSKIPDTVK